MKELLPLANVKPTETLQKLLARLLFGNKHEQEQFMSPKKFSKVIGWFGSARGMKNENIAGSSVQHLTYLFQHIEKILAEPWFHGKMNKDDAEGCLQGKPVGTYLVRLNLTDGGKDNLYEAPFTITRRADGNKISHTRVRIRDPNSPPQVPNVYYVPVEGTNENLFSDQGDTLQCLLTYLFKLGKLATPYEKPRPGVYAAVNRYDDII